MAVPPPQHPFDNLRTRLPTLDPPDVYATLETRESGLPSTEAQERLRRHGRNAVPEIKGKPLYLEFLGNFTHLMALLLWIGGLIAFVTQSPELGIAIWLVNAINGSFSFWQEYKAEKAIEALREMLPTYARVIRDGQEARILAEELTPGDVVLLSEGDRISADARLVESADLRVDQSTLTGEARPASKMHAPLKHPHLPSAEVPNMVFAGTCVVAGSGRAVVFATGAHSEFGTIAHLTQSLGEAPDPLQRELGRVTATITRVSVSIGVAFFFLVHLLLDMDWAASFLIALGMLIAFVPEGLLPTLTLSLAIAVQHMARRHALIKKLSSVETLGRTTVICTDKTGTLTENQMTVQALWVAGQAYEVSGEGYLPQGAITLSGRPVATPAQGDLRDLVVAGALCNDAHLVPPHTERAEWSALGDPTEAALLVLALKAGVEPRVETRNAPRLRELAFNSYRRRMSTIHHVGDTRLVCMKGAPKDVLALCTRVRWEGEDREVDTAIREAIDDATDALARGGLRVLAVAMRSLGAHLETAAPESIEREMTFLGLVAMLDPPRPDVPEAVRRCHQAGIRIIMLTGDYSLTASGIARTIGITRGPDPRLLTGVEVAALNNDELDAVLQHEVLFSRITPEQKLRIVSALQRRGQVVAVTGDGVNDAPALRQADIGVAMGLSGTDVAKEAADMILTDDHFASIVNAIEEGRAVYANIRKFILYVFGSNMAEGVPFVLTLLTRGAIPLPITVMQTLAVDLGTDMVPAIGLGAEQPESGVMDQPPRPHEERLLDPRTVALGLLWYGAIDSLAAMSAYYFVNWEHGWPGHALAALGTPLYRTATTMTFTGIVAAQMGAALACRSERDSLARIGPLSNRLVVTGILLEVALLLLLMYVPLFQGIFNTTPISPFDWAFVLGWAPLMLLADEARKGIVRWSQSR